MSVSRRDTITGAIGAAAGASIAAAALTSQPSKPTNSKRRTDAANGKATEVFSAKTVAVATATKSLISTREPEPTVHRERVKTPKVERSDHSLLAELADVRNQFTIGATKRLATIDGANAGKGCEPLRCDIIGSQIMALVGRALQTRTNWSALYRVFSDTVADLDRFEQLDAIHKQEEADGYYTLDASLSQGELDSARAMQGPLQLASSMLLNLKENVETNFDDQFGWIQLIGWLSHISGYTRGQAANTVIWNSVEKTVIEYCHEAATAQGQFQLANAIQQLGSDYVTKEGQAQSVLAKLPGLEAKADWDVKNETFRKLRTDVVRKIYAERRAAISQPGGPLNYKEQLNALQENFLTDAAESMRKWPTIVQGFKCVFGLDVAPLKQLQTTQNKDALDAMQIELRRVGLWLTDFSQRDQVYSTILSAKQLGGRQASSGRIFTFEVNEAAFPDQCCVRIRAFSIYVKGISGPIPAEVSCPSRGFFRHADGSTAWSDQACLPLHRTGRVSEFGAAQPPERLGINSAYNASPFGVWTVSLAEKSLMNDGVSDVEDIFLEIIVTSQSIALPSSRGSIL